MDTLELPIEGRPSATGMGNPHCTFFVEDAEVVPIWRSSGPVTKPMSFSRSGPMSRLRSVIGPDHIRMRVWERGVGITLASGSSSCATAVAAARRGLSSRKVGIDLDGGTLDIDWRDDGVWMTGPTMHVFDGVLTAEFLRAVE